MTEYAIFLRGINVGGVRMTMNDLRACLEAGGIDRPVTYLQTGNVVCRTDMSASELTHTAERILRERFEYEAFVVVVKMTHLRAIIEAFPWQATEGVHSYVVFGSQPLILDELLELSSTTDTVAAGEDVIYWQVAKGATTTSPFGALLAKPRYKPSTTVRNIATLRKMLS